MNITTESAEPVEAVVRPIGWNWHKIQAAACIVLSGCVSVGVLVWVVSALGVVG